jgi:hypothetical protein
VSRPAATVLAGAYFAALAVAVAVAGPPLEQPAPAHHRVVGYGQIRFDGAGPEKWAARYRRTRDELRAARRELRARRRVLLSSSSVAEAINLAATVYGNGSTLWRKARCETGGTFDPKARNRSSDAAGLFQFLGSTWRSTPFAGFDVDSPYANALAAGWMHAHGRGGEWDCR